jgi:GntR family transcriptional regulator
MEFDRNLPVYRQIIELIKMRIIRQEYPSGTMVPTIRSLAEEFCVTNNTLQRAYVELVREGYLIPLRGLGYKVTDEKRKLTKLRETSLKERFEKLHQDAIKMGISDFDLCRLFDEHINQVKKNIIDEEPFLKRIKK